MFRPRHLLAAFPLLLLVACSDQATTPTGVARAPVPAANTDLIGTIMRTSGREGGIQLVPDGGGAILLFGDQTELLMGLVDAGVRVQVHGTLDLVEGMAVERFLVLGVNGHDAMDGTVVQTDDGYALRLTVDDSMLPLIDPPAALKELAGERVWVVGGRDEPAEAFGIIGHRG